MKTATVVALMLTASGWYLFVITTLIPGWSDVSIGDQLFMFAPAALMWAGVVAICKSCNQ